MESSSSLCLYLYLYLTSLFLALLLTPSLSHCHLPLIDRCWHHEFMLCIDKYCERIAYHHIVIVRQSVASKSFPQFSKLYHPYE